MTVGYALTFEFDTRPPVTHRGTLTEDQALELVGLLLETDDPPVSPSSNEPASTAAREETSETSENSEQWINPRPWERA